MALKLSDIKKKFKVDSNATVLESKNITIADMRIKSIRAIDRHIKKSLEESLDYLVIQTIQT